MSIVLYNILFSIQFSHYLLDLHYTWHSIKLVNDLFSVLYTF